MKGWELAESGASAVVTYRCVQGTRGTTLGAIFADQGDPVFAWFGPADTAKAPARWFGTDSLTESGDRVEGYPDLIPLHCHRHGYWLIPRDAMLEHWESARDTKPATVKLDKRNAWHSPTD